MNYHINDSGYVILSLSELPEHTFTVLLGGPLAIFYREFLSFIELFHCPYSHSVLSLEVFTYFQADLDLNPNFAIHLLYDVKQITQSL